jgi:hypothetical protein
MLMLVFEPLSVAVIATVPPVAAPLTFKPATCEAVEESTLKAGLVAPVKPTERALAEAEVITPRAETVEPPMVVVAGSVTTPPVATTRGSVALSLMPLWRIS